MIRNPNSPKYYRKRTKIVQSLLFTIRNAPQLRLAAEREAEAARAAEEARQLAAKAEHELRMAEERRKAEAVRSELDVYLSVVQVVSELVVRSVFPGVLRIMVDRVAG